LRQILHPALPGIGKSDSAEIDTEDLAVLPVEEEIPARAASRIQDRQVARFFDIFPQAFAEYGSEIPEPPVPVFRGIGFVIQAVIHGASKKTSRIKKGMPGGIPLDGHVTAG